MHVTVPDVITRNFSTCDVERFLAPTGLGEVRGGKS